MKMNSTIFNRELILPSTAFIVTSFLHYIWIAFFPETDSAQNQWVLLPEEISLLQNYIDTGSYWLGYSYGLCFAFFTAAFRNYQRTKCRYSKKLAFSGVAIPGVLAATVCFIIGCCGSPMLVVWLNLFGASFLPFAKPFIAVITTLTVGIAWFWMYKKRICCE